MRLTEDFHIHYSGNPNEIPEKVITPDELRFETGDMLDRILANPKRIENLVMDGGKSDFDFPETATFFELISKLMTCRADDRIDAIDDLRKLCERRLHDEAEEMARQYLEAEEGYNYWLKERA